MSSSDNKHERGKQPSYQLNDKLGKIYKRLSPLFTLAVKVKQPTS